MAAFHRGVSTCATKRSGGALLINKMWDFFQRRSAPRSERTRTGLCVTAVRWPPPSLMPTACSGCYITSCFSPRAKKSCTCWQTTGRRVRLFWTNTWQGWKWICKNQRVLFYFSLFPRLNRHCNPLITHCSIFNVFPVSNVSDLFIFNLVVKRKKFFLINTCLNWIRFYLFLGSNTR